MKAPGRKHRRPSLEALQLNEARWQAVLRSSPDAIVGIDGEGRITLFNPTAERMFGHSAADVIGKNVGLLMPPPYSEEHDGYIRRYRETGDARAIGRVRHVKAKRKDGEVFPVELSVSEANVAGEAVYMAIIRDVTERSRAETRLAAQAQQQAAVASLGRIELTSGDLGALMQEAASLVSRSLGTRYVSILEVIPDEKALLLRAGVGWRIRTGERIAVRVTPNSPAGRALATGAPVIVEDLRAEGHSQDWPGDEQYGLASGLCVLIVPVEGHGQAFGVLGAHSEERRSFTSDDVNFLQSIANFLSEAIARHRAEAELAAARQNSRQRERLADIGAITAKLVHDLGNPLAAVSMQAQLILRRSRRGDVQPAALIEQPAERVLSTVRRLESLVREFNSFAREQRLASSSVDLPRFLQAIVDLWNPLAGGRGVEVRLVDNAHGLSLRADEEKIRRVLDNLIANAVEAVEPGPGEVLVRVSIPTTEKVRISVEDSGPGIPEGVDVFRLFETTKPEGTGIGLAVAKQIVLAHGGTIEHAMREPHGAVFHVDLPRRGPTRI